MADIYWLPAPKLREYYVGPIATDVQEAQRGVVSSSGDRPGAGTIEGQFLSLKQIALMREINPFSMPPEIELSIDDARRKWGGLYNLQRIDQRPLARRYAVLGTAMTSL